MDSHGPSASPHRDGRLVVCRLGSDAVQIANRTIEDVYRQVVTVHRAATPAPRITEMVSVQDWETKALHLLLVHRLDYRPQGASAVRDVVVFSEPTYAVFRTERLRLATPAYYRGQQDLRPGIRDVHDGTLTKDSIRWANTVVQAGMVTSSRMLFVSSREPWVYCASHYQLDRELRRLKDHFAKKYGYTAATRIRDPNAFAMWLGVDFALNLNKTTDVRLGALDKINYALSSYSANLWPGSGRDRHRSARLPWSSSLRGQLGLYRHAGRLVRPTRRPACVVHQEDVLHEPMRIPLRGFHDRRPRQTETRHRRVTGATRTHLCPMSPGDGCTGLGGLAGLVGLLGGNGRERWYRSIFPCVIG